MDGVLTPLTRSAPSNQTLNISRTPVTVMQRLNAHVSSNRRVGKGYRLGLGGPATGENHFQLEVHYMGSSAPVFHSWLLSQNRSEVHVFKNIYRLSNFKDHLQRPRLQRALLKPSTASFRAVPEPPACSSAPHPGSRGPQGPRIHGRASPSDAESRLAATLNT